LERLKRLKGFGKLERLKRFEKLERFGSKGSISSMSSKGLGFSSADVGVINNHQSKFKYCLFHTKLFINGKCHQPQKPQNLKNLPNPTFSKINF